MDVANAGRIVVGVDHSLAALEALRHAVTEARRRRCPLRAVRVWQVGVPWRGYDVDLCRDEAGTEAEATIRRCFEWAMGGLPRDLEFELTAVEGSVGSALVAQATNENDLLILGAPTRRRWGPSAFRVHRYCVRRASCPVVVVPAPAIARQRGTRALVRAIRRDASRFASPGHSTAPLG
jgi:nucleotide-binding universal stress UspA family protein